MSKFKPDGWPTVAPRIITRDVIPLVEFLRAVFRAEAEPHPGAPVEVRIGDSIVMISDGGGSRVATPAFLHVYVENADEVYDRSLAEGAETVEAPADMPYGDRRATVRDPWGNLWQIATYRERR